MLIATLVTNHAWNDLIVFCKTLALWNPHAPPTLYIFVDNVVLAKIPELGYPGRIHTKCVLDGYSGKRRTEMETLPGKVYSSLFFDFTVEKLTLLEWVFKAEPSRAREEGVWFMDADICFFGHLPPVPAAGIDVALCPHMIRKYDEDRYGRYNAGYLWVRCPEAVQDWRAACRTSRFFEQAALEVFESEAWAGRMMKFPIQDDYGWWRMSQGREGPETARGQWTIHRSPQTCGIYVAGQPLRSVHTHWHRGGISEPAVQAFNEFVMAQLQKLERAWPPAKALLRILVAAAARA